MNDILEYKGFFAEVHFSSEDEVFFGKLLGINDLVNFEGSTVKQEKNPKKLTKAHLIFEFLPNYIGKLHFMPQ